MRSPRPRYCSSIPTEAEETVTETYPSGAKKRAEYRVNGEIVGYRGFHETGEPDMETPIRDGRRHGTCYFWYEPGILTSAQPYREDLPHGTARQWDKQGRLLGTYIMRRGTGVDLWWQDWADGTAGHMEVHPEYEGDPHGFEWWFRSKGSLWWERHWQRGHIHGIEREWNYRGGLRRGYPKYWVNTLQVNRARYLRAAAKDPTLPPYRPEDDDPHREFPPEIAAVLTKKLSESDDEWRESR